MTVEVGEVAPDFTLVDTDRKPRRLSEFRGKNVVLAFFPGAFTPVCTTEMCAFRDRTDKLSAMDAQVIGISVDPPFAQKAWADQHKLNFLLLSDYRREVVHQYGVALPNLAGLEGYTAANRAVFVIDREGIVRYKWIAPERTKEPNYEEINQLLSGLPT